MMGPVYHKGHGIGDPSPLPEAEKDQNNRRLFYDDVAVCMCCRALLFIRMVIGVLNTTYRVASSATCVPYGHNAIGREDRAIS